MPYPGACSSSTTVASIKSVIDNIHDTDLPAVKTVVDGVALYRQRTLQASFSKLTNAAVFALGTVSAAAGDSVVVDSIIIRTTTVAADLTSIRVTAFSTDVVEFISTTIGDAANLNAIGEQVSWSGKIELPASTPIRFTIAGGGANTYEFVATIQYRNACPAGTGVIA